ELEMLGLLATLIDQSLVVRQVEVETARPRFTMLETIRAFGLEQLTDSGEEATVRAAHAGWYLALAEQAELAALMPGLEPQLDRRETERDNLRSASRWREVQGEVELLLQLTAALRWFWYVRGPYHEAREWLHRAQDLNSSAMTLAAAKVVGMLGLLTVYQ